MLMAIATKTGIAAGVDLATLRRFVQDGLLLSSPPPPPAPPAAVGAAVGAEATATATAEVAAAESEAAAAAAIAVQQEEELSPEAKAEIKTAVMLVSGHGIHSLELADMLARVLMVARLDSNLREDSEPRTPMVCDVQLSVEECLSARNESGLR